MAFEWHGRKNLKSRSTESFFQENRLLSLCRTKFMHCVNCDVVLFCFVSSSGAKEVWSHPSIFTVLKYQVVTLMLGMFIDSLPLKSQMAAGLKWQRYLLKVSFAFWCILWFTMKWKNAWHWLLRLKSVVGHYSLQRGYFPIFNKPTCQKFRGTFPGWYLRSEVIKSFC